MENPKPPINEAELIQHGKEMIVDGLGSTFVYKWVRERVEDQETRSRIIEKIHNIDGKANVPKDKDEVIKQRKIREGKYIYEDCLEAIEHTTRVGKVYLLFGVLYLV